MATSNATFNSPQIEFVITEAFERIGLPPSPALIPEQVASANRSLNLILSTWANRGWNLFTTRYAMLYLENNKRQYALPSTTTGILEVILRTSVRQLNGTAFSTIGGGTAPALAFDNNPATACVQVAINGNIGYQWTSQQAIQLVGVQSNVDRNYTLQLQYSNDGSSYFDGLTFTTSQAFTRGKIVWFEIPVPSYGTYFRVQETGGAILDIQELYFNNLIQDYTMTPFSHSNYMETPNKFTLSRPTSYYFDRQINPYLYIYPVPGVVPDSPLMPSSNPYNCLLYSYKEAINDIGTLLNNPAIPQRFLEALCAELAYRLAVKYAPDKTELLKGLADIEFGLASREDTERVSFYTYGLYGGYSRP